MATKRKATSKKAPPAPAGGRYRASAIYQAPQTIAIHELPPQFSRADLEFIGVDHSGPSYEARVYLNNAKANAGTPKSEENGYAGSYYIFGHGGCFGDVGHCDIHPIRDSFDPRPSHPLEPIRKVVIATEAVRRAVARGGEITITVVPIVLSWSEKSDTADVMRFDHINLVTYE